MTISTSHRYCIADSDRRLVTASATGHSKAFHWSDTPLRQPMAAVRVKMRSWVEQLRADGNPPDCVKARTLIRTQH
jgi:hypothetical protein